MNKLMSICYVFSKIANGKSPGLILPSDLIEHSERLRTVFMIFSDLAATMPCDQSSSKA